jgi:phage tail sheath protein FI
MANFVSPGVYVVEKDISDYPASINSSVVGIVGFAGRGPIAGVSHEKATLITSQQQLIDTFGEPSEDIKGQALEGALEILNGGTNSMRFVRCASGAVEASGVATIGGCPAVWVDLTPSVMPGIGLADATVSGVRFTITGYDNSRNKIRDTKVYTIPKNTLSLSSTNGGTSVAAMSQVIGGSLNADTVGFFANANNNESTTSGYIVGLAAGQFATLEVKMELQNDDDAWVGVNAIKTLNYLGAESSVTQGANTTTASGTSIDPSSAGYLAQSLWPGGGYNAGTKADGTTSGVSFEVNINGGATVAAQVNNLGTAAESFIGGLTSGTAFIENQIGTTYDGKTSDYITGNVVTGTYVDITTTSLPRFESYAKDLVGGAVDLNGDSGGNGGEGVTEVNPRFIKLVQGTYNLSGGTNGIPADDTSVATAIIGATQSDGGKTGIEALDDDVLNISIALAPGTGVGDLQNVQNALITKAEKTQNFIALISPPYAVGTPGDAIDWTNGFGGTRTAAINNSYAAIYWPWLKVFSVWDNKDRWLAPEIFGARQMGVTDAVADPWFAPAGFVRGLLSKPTDVEVSLNQGDRDSMYSGGNVINPIVNFPQRGIAIFGQRTAQRDPTALDRINIRRMMIYIKKALLASTQRLVFEPNDKFTWQRVEQLVNPMLDEISRRRGITEFKCVCDETVNTPIRVDRNEMWCKVLIKPTKTAEIVIFELNLTNQSANLGSL